MTKLQRVFFLGGQLGLMLLVRFFLQWITFFATQKGPEGTPSAGLALFSAGLVGTTLLVFRVFDGAIDPVAGALSDGWYGRVERQLLWYAFLRPPVGLALIFHLLMTCPRLCAGHLSCRGCSSFLLATRFMRFY